MPYPPPRSAPLNGPGRCPRCHRDVLWTTTSANRVAQAVDPDRDPAGNIAVRQDATGRYVSRQLTKDRPTLEGAEHLHMPHVVTCPVPPPRRTPAPRIPRGRTGVRPAPWRPR